MDYHITESEVAYLRRQAELYARYASEPVMNERSELWYAHNRLESDRPVIVVENSSFNDDFLPPAVCTSEFGRYVEKLLVNEIWNYEKISDDKVIPPYLSLSMPFSLMPFGRKRKVRYSKDSQGREIGFQTTHLIRDLEKDLLSLAPSEISVDTEAVNGLREAVERILGDILPVRVKNEFLNWSVSPTIKVVELMGMEAMMYAMYDSPDALHALMRFITADTLRILRWMESEGLLSPNNGNDYAGSGSYGFTDELPRADRRAGAALQTQDLWGNLNSQESVGISPEMFGTFIFPYYRELAGQFGLLYYGCCEPVHDVWQEYLSTLPNLRKVSVSPWCDQKLMGEYLRGSSTIFSRKPSPNFIGVGRELDEKGFTEHITETLEAAKGTTLEIIFRDIYTLEGNIEKPGKAVRIIRELIDRLW